MIDGKITVFIQLMGWVGKMSNFVRKSPLFTAPESKHRCVPCLWAHIRIMVESFHPLLVNWVFIEHLLCTKYSIRHWEPKRGIIKVFSSISYVASVVDYVISIFHFPAVLKYLKRVA